MTAFDTAWAIAKADTGMWDEWVDRPEWKVIYD
jgi:hypothetical protein